ncbi:MAG: DM13 domain-containing protein [Chloroflexi bacterium]|nr:DM13 domain-containing protein [Chloroflexota bacterium]
MFQGFRPVHKLLITALALMIIAIVGFLASPLFLGRSVDEEFPFTSGARIPDEMTRPQAEAIMKEAAARDVAATEAMPGGGAPTLLTVGEFDEIDFVHKGQGKAEIFRLAGGGHLLRLEDFRVTNGPNLFVVLSGHGRPGDPGELREGAYLELAPLKGNMGNQNYPLPADFQPARFKSAVIYCKAFSVIFSRAALKPA